MVETVPTLETVTQYNEHLLAELEQMGQQARKKEVMAEGQPKVCRRGRGCPFGHQLDGEKKCWTCDGRDHMATTCPTTEESESKPRAAQTGSKTTESDATDLPRNPSLWWCFQVFWGPGREKKTVSKLQDAFWRPILGTFWRMFAVFLVLAKSQNIVIYSGFCAFGTEQVLLATC